MLFPLPLSALAGAALAHLLAEDRIRSYRSRVDYVRVAARRLVWRRWPFVSESVALGQIQETGVSTPPRDAGLIHWTP
jgi:hypothetical protein